MISDEAKAQLRALGRDPDKVITETIRCVASDGRSRVCGRHIATVYLEGIGDVLRFEDGPRGHVTVNEDRPRQFPDQRWFDVHCEKHDLSVTLQGNTTTVYS